MPAALDFYFDFMSPYAYLAYRKLPALAREFDLLLTPRVVDLSAAKIAAGNTGPRNVDIPPKIRYLRTDLARWAERYDTPLIFPQSLDSRRMNKGTFFATDRNAIGAYLDAAWSVAWASGDNIGDRAVLGRLARDLGWREGAFLDFLDSSEAAERYEEATLSAQRRGVFGVPTMMVGDEMWWGNDRLDFLRESLARCAGKLD